MYVYIPYQTTYLKVIGTASNQIGIIVGAYGISQMLLRFPVGVLADRQNYHKVFILTGGGAAAIASVFRIFLNDSLGFFIGKHFFRSGKCHVDFFYGAVHELLSR